MGTKTEKILTASKSLLLAATLGLAAFLFCTKAVEARLTPPNIDLTQRSPALQTPPPATPSVDSRPSINFDGSLQGGGSSRPPAQTAPPSSSDPAVQVATKVATAALGALVGGGLIPFGGQITLIPQKPPCLNGVGMIIKPAGVSPPNVFYDPGTILYDYGPPLAKSQWELGWLTPYFCITSYKPYTQIPTMRMLLVGTGKPGGANAAGAAGGALGGAL